MNTTVPPLPLPFRCHPQLANWVGQQARTVQAAFIKCYTMLLYLYCYMMPWGDAPLSQFSHGLSQSDRDDAFNNFQALMLWGVGLNNPLVPPDSVPKKFSPNLTMFLYYKTLAALFGEANVEFHVAMAERMLPCIIWNEQDPEDLFPVPWPNNP